jgi:YgiT-type zinc finger domain-containing protein
MKCVICKHGETKNGTTTITLERGSSTIVFKDVPAQICNNCGEKYVDSKITKELLKKANELVKNGTEVDIRKFQVAA